MTTSTNNINNINNNINTDKSVPKGCEDKGRKTEGTSKVVHFSESLPVFSEFIPHLGEMVGSTGVQPSHNQSLFEREPLKDVP